MEVRIAIRDNRIIELLENLSSIERRIVTETALLYYAKYLEDNPQIIDPILDVTKLPCNIGKDFGTEGQFENNGVISEDHDVACNILRYAMDKRNEKEVFNNVDNPSKIVIRLNSNIEKIQQMLEYVSPRSTDLIETALLCYIYILETDPRIVDFRLRVKKK